MNGCNWARDKKEGERESEGERKDGDEDGDEDEDEEVCIHCVVRLSSSASETKV